MHPFLECAPKCSAREEEQQRIPQNSRIFSSLHSVIGHDSTVFRNHGSQSSTQPVTLHYDSSPGSADHLALQIAQRKVFRYTLLQCGLIEFTFQRRPGGVELN